jgi:methylenetetrahydrofolate dehydrogenase (NADP+) / methenyltetrahydrofolate cyclohydrolase
MGIIVDGNAISRDICAELKEQVRGLHFVPSLSILTMEPDFTTTRYLRIKEACASEVGITVETQILSQHTTTEELLAHMKSECVHDGVVLQLPFPAHVDVDTLLSALPAKRDPDMMGVAARQGLSQHHASLLPPVTAAIAEISARHNIAFQGKRCAIVGHGMLVGAPTALWASHRGADVTIITKENFDSPSYREILKHADIIVLGVGKQGLLTADMISAHTAVFDAGTSEDQGRLAGDASPEVRDVAYLSTPVPGGIGPIAVACLMRNLVELAEFQRYPKGAS